MIKATRRRLIIGATAMAGVIAMPPVLGQQTRKISFITPFGYLIGFAPTLNAQAGGHFGREGLDLTVFPGKGSAVAVQQVIAGRAVYGRGDPLAVAKAVAEGAPIVAFATALHRSPIVVYSSPQKPVRNAREMQGKVIGIAAKGSASDNIMDLMFATLGLPLDGARREAVGNSPGGWGLIQQGRLDAHIVSIGTTTTLQESGENILLWNTSDAVPMPGQAYFALRETVQKDPDVLLRILRAEKASMIELRKGDGQRLVERMAKLWEIDEAKNIAFAVKAMRNEEPLWWHDDTAKLLKNDASTWKSMIDGMTKAGLLKGGLAADRFYTDEITNRL